MAANGLVVDTGRQFRARLLSGESLAGLSWMAIGDGDWTDKTAPPSEDKTQTGLKHELARKQIDRFAFLEQDDVLGDISFENHKYKEVAYPTDIIAFFATFNEDEASGMAIAEEGLFGGSISTSRTPYALAAQVQTPGILYWVRNRGAYNKGTRDTYQVIAIFKETN